ncbi:uncharacterized protein LOC135843691 [Planococcus citri]|uniref:uncharacterized protein LOC135843691 n=1 Tax=Planococcus citri TaxID=170843 RepID=UPI0031F86E44
MSYFQAICAKCNKPLFPVEHHNQLHITTCHHVYHQRCVTSMLTETPNRNPRIARCAITSCKRFLAAQDFKRIDFLYVTEEILPQQPPPPPPPTNRGEVNMLHDLNRQLEDTIVSMTEEMRHLKIRLFNAEREIDSANDRYQNLLSHQINRLQSTDQRNPATFFRSPHLHPPPGAGPSQMNILRMPIRQTFHFDRDNVPISYIESPNQFKTPPPPPQQPTYRDNSSQRDANYDSDSKRKRESTSSEECSGDRQTPPAPRRSKKKKSNKPPQEPPKKIKGTPGNKGNYHNRYRKRWGTDSSELLPYYPFNSYPFDFTAAGYQIGENQFLGAWYAFNILLIGDGHMAKLAEFLGKGKKYDKFRDHDLYRRNLLLEDLIAYLREFECLPSRIMVSIGNFDAHEHTPYDKFDKQMNELCTLINEKFHVRELILVPLLPLPARSNHRHSRENIERALDQNWGAEFGAVTTRIDHLFEEIHAGHAYYDEFGPYYKLDDYKALAERIAAQFIPPLQPRPSALAAQAAAEAAENAGENQQEQVAGVERMEEDEPCAPTSACNTADSAVNTSSGNPSSTASPKKIFSSQQVGNAIITAVISSKTNEAERKRQEFFANRQLQIQKEAAIEKEENKQLKLHADNIEAFVDFVNKGEVNDIYLQTQVFDKLCKKQLAKTSRSNCSTPRTSSPIPDVSNLSVDSPNKSSFVQPQAQESPDTSQADASENISEPSTVSTWLESINEGDEFDEAINNVVDQIENASNNPQIEPNDDKKPDDNDKKADDPGQDEQ